MADQKLVEITENVTPALNDVVYTVSGGSDRKVSVDNINMGLVLLEEQTVSGVSSIDMESWYSYKYDDYVIECINLLVATDTDNIYLRMSTDGGSTYDSGSNYGTAEFYNRDGATNDDLGDNSGATYIKLGHNLTNTVAYGGVSGSIRFYNPSSTTYYKTVNFNTSCYLSSPLYLYNFTGTGMYYSTSAVNAFQILASSGNISGTVRVYGRRRTYTTTTTT